MTNQQHQLENEAMEVLEMMEDMVEYVCKEHTISGEKVYFMIHELSRIKLNEFPQDPEAVSYTHLTLPTTPYV